VAERTERLNRAGPRHLPWRGPSAWLRSLAGAVGRLRIAVHGPAVALLAAALLAAGCSLHPPEIFRVSWQQTLVYEPDRDLAYPALSLFVQVNDPDGLDDLQELYLIGDRQELYWRLDPQTWVQVRQGAETWIGSNTFSLPDRRSVPEGEYRLLLVDLAGQRVEQTVRIASPGLDLSRARFPRATIEGEWIRVEGIAAGADAAPAAGPARPPSGVTLWLYGPDGQYRGSWEYRPEGIRIPDLLSAYPELIGGFQFRVYRFLEKENLGLVSGPWRYSP
jgi:hypothetical protein